MLETNDDTLSLEDAAEGYKGLIVIECCFRLSLKRTQIKMSTLYHWLPRRIEAHVKVCHERTITVIISIFGSPRRKGNTAKVLSMFEDTVNKNHEVERIDINQQNVGGCLGCHKCQEKSDEPGCVQKDDALDIFEKMMASDAIVYASPLYCWSFSSQIKPLIDRLFCLVTGYGTPDHNSLVGGKRAALLMTCAGPIEGNCNAIRSIFSAYCEYAKMTSIGSFILPFCTTPDAIGAGGAKLAGELAKAATQ